MGTRSNWIMSGFESTVSEIMLDYQALLATNRPETSTETAEATVSDILRTDPITSPGNNDDLGALQEEISTLKEELSRIKQQIKQQAEDLSQPPPDPPRPFRASCRRGTKAGVRGKPHRIVNARERAEIHLPLCRQPRRVLNQPLQSLAGGHPTSLFHTTETGENRKEKIPSTPTRGRAIETGVQRSALGIWRHGRNDV